MNGNQENKQSMLTNNGSQEKHTHHINKEWKPGKTNTKYSKVTEIMYNKHNVFTNYGS